MARKIINNINLSTSDPKSCHLTSVLQDKDNFFKDGGTAGFSLSLPLSSLRGNMGEAASSTLFLCSTLALVTSPSAFLTTAPAASLILFLTRANSTPEMIVSSRSFWVGIQ